MLPTRLEQAEHLKAAPRRARRDALRALRGSMLRTELYALDGSERAAQPYTVTESQYGVREEAPPAGDPERPRIFFPHLLARRTTQWERGDDPMTQFSFSQDYDGFGQPRRQTQVACPRGWRRLDDRPAELGGADHEQRFLATRSVVTFAQRDDEQSFMVDRIASATRFELENDGALSLPDLLALLDDDANVRVIGQALTFYDGEAFVGLPLGQLGDFGAPVRSERLALTEELLRDAYRIESGAQTAPFPPYLAPGAAPAWTGDYPQSFREYVEGHPDLLGYSFSAGAGVRRRGYFVQAERTAYDFQTDSGRERGLPMVRRDPLGHDVTVAYDRFSLLPVTVTDAVGLTTSATYDYRVLQPLQIVDPNGNLQSFGYSPLGLLRWSALHGKQGEGDTLEKPGVRYEYDFLAFANSPPENRQPVWVRSIQRVQHAADIDSSLMEPDQTITTIEYSDGFGRLLQTRTEAEDTLFGDPTFGHGVIPADPNDSAGTQAEMRSRSRRVDDPANVVVSGWQTYNNKGWVVERFEPFYAQGWDYLSRREAQALAADGDADFFGQKTTISYDPRGQAIRTLNPDGSEQRVLYGVPADLSDPGTFAPTPWEAYTYDANDNAGRTHPTQSQAYTHHWNTPASVELDPLGRAVTAIERNGDQPADWLVTRSTYDIHGNLLTVTDPLGRVAFRYVYDLAGNPWRIDSIDAGIKRTVLDARGSPVESRDSKGALALSMSDRLNRPVALWARDDAPAPRLRRWRRSRAAGRGTSSPTPGQSSR